MIEIMYRRTTELIKQEISGTQRTEFEKKDVIPFHSIPFKFILI